MRKDELSIELLSPYLGVSWKLPPAIPGAWFDLSEARSKLVIDRISETLGTDIFRIFRQNILVEAIRVFPTKFYKDWMICDIQVQASLNKLIGSKQNKIISDKINNCEHLILAYLYGPDGFVPLSGSSSLIHAHNKIHGVDLSTDAKRQDYLRFFSFAVHGSDGPFLIREEVSTVNIGMIERTSEDQANIMSALQPLKHVKDAMLPEGHYAYQACVQFGSALFASKFALRPNGEVEMLDDNPLAEHVTGSPAICYLGHIRYANQSLPEEPEI